MSTEESKKIISNQIILDGKLNQIINELDFIKSELKVAINNELLLEKYEREIIDRLNRIENKIK